MNQNNYNKRNTMMDIISEYEAMSQKGTVVFFEEKVFMELIEYYENESSFDKAMTVVDHALVQHSFSPDLLFCKAKLLFDAEKVKAALDCLEKAYALSPNNAKVQIFRSEVLSTLGYHQEALSILEELNQDEDAPMDFYWCKAIIQEQIGEFGNMFDSLKQYLVYNPRNVNALRKAWLCVELSGAYQDSITFHERLLDTDPYSYLAWHNLGQAYKATKNYKKAAWAFEYSFITNPKFESGYQDYADVCFELGYYDKALQAYEELLEHFNADAQTLLQIGKCYEFKEDFGIAQAFYIKAEIMNPNNAEVYFRMGECYAKRQKWECAIDTYKKALDIEKHNEIYYASIGEAYYQIGEDAAAESYFQKAADTAPEEPTYWLQYASFLMDTSRIDEAVEVIDEARIYTSGAELDYCMAACLLRNGSKKAAIKLLVKALNENYDKHEIFFNLIPNISKEVEILHLIKIYSQN